MPILQHVMFNAYNNKNFWTESKKSQKKNSVRLRPFSKKIE